MPEATSLSAALTLRIDGTLWFETNDLSASGPDDRHYVFDRDSGRLSFGDGKHGAVPTAGAKFHLELRIGGGVTRKTGVYELEVPQGGTVVIHPWLETGEESGQKGDRAKRLGVSPRSLAHLPGSSHCARDARGSTLPAQGDGGRPGGGPNAPALTRPGPASTLERQRSVGKTSRPDVA